MFCPSCGLENEGNVMFCANCGIRLTPYAIELSEIGETLRGLKWAGFLGRFLWFCVLGNIIGGIKMILGSDYGDIKDTLYGMYRGLQAVNVMYGICLFAWAGMEAVAAISIIKRKKLAIKIVPCMFLTGAVIMIAYMVIASLVIDQPVVPVWMIISTVTCIIMLFANKAYFGKRKNIFVD